MVDVNNKVIRSINHYLDCTPLPRFVLLKGKSWAYEKDGATVYMFSNPEDTGEMIVAIFKGKSASIEYSVVSNGEYHKISYDFYDGVVVKISHFDTKKEKGKGK